MKYATDTTDKFVYDYRSTTLCPKKVVHQTHAITLSALNGFSKFFHCWKDN